MTEEMTVVDYATGTRETRHLNFSEVAGYRSSLQSTALRVQG